MWASSCDAYASSAGRLCFVHRLVGSKQELVDGHARLAEGDPGACADRDLDATHDERGGEAVEQAFGEIAGLGLAHDVFHQQSELVTTHASRGVCRPDLAANALRHEDQQLVAPGVAEGVVDPLEPVEVDVDDRQGRRPPHRSRQSVGDPVVEEAPIGEAGERVPHRLLLVELPSHDARCAGGENEASVDEGPTDRLRHRGGVVVDRARSQRADQSVVDDDEPDRGEERQPVLIQGQDPDHHEEVEVHLDGAAGEMYQHRGGDHEPQSGHR